MIWLYIRNSTKATILKEFTRGLRDFYVVTPFKINEQHFLDFYPIEYQDDANDLLSTHIVYTHSLVKYNVLQNGKIEIKWLDEKKIEKLFEKKRHMISLLRNILTLKMRKNGQPTQNTR